MECPPELSCTHWAPEAAQHLPLATSKHEQSGFPPLVVEHIISGPELAMGSQHRFVPAEAKQNIVELPPGRLLPCGIWRSHLCCGMLSPSPRKNKESETNINYCLGPWGCKQVILKCQTAPFPTTFFSPQKITELTAQNHVR